MLDVDWMTRARRVGEHDTDCAEENHDSRRGLIASQASRVFGDAT
jgi:hypothetical protein